MNKVSADIARGLAAAGVMLSAVVHLDLWALQGFRDLSVIGPLFLLNGIAGIVLATVVVCWRHWLPALAAAGFGAATVGAFWISVLHGLFGLHEIATGSSQVLAEIAEYVAVAFGLAASVGLRPARRGRRTGPVAPGAAVHRHRVGLPR